MVKIEGEDELRKELEQQRNSEALLQFLLAAAVLTLAIIYSFRVGGINTLGLIGLLVAAVFFVRGRRIRRRQVPTKLYQQDSEGPFKSKW